MKKDNSEFRISIDFDGTIVEEDYPRVGRLRTGADFYIKKLKTNGFTIIINSCRTGKFEGEAFKFLKENEIPFDYFNCNDPKLIVEYGMDCRKISADVYIDDKSIGDLPDWSEIYDLVMKKYSKLKETPFRVTRLYEDTYFVGSENNLKAGDYVLLIPETKGSVIESTKTMVTSVSEDKNTCEMIPITLPFFEESRKTSRYQAVVVWRRH